MSSYDSALIACILYGYITTLISGSILATRTVGLVPSVHSTKRADNSMDT